MFMKVTIRQQSEGTPGFVEADDFEIQINAKQITLFNRSEEDDDITFVRLACGATICVVMTYNAFVKKLQSALKSGDKVTR